MGSSASKSEHEAKIWHEELAEMQRIQMERQIELQNMMWERTMALSAARTRDSFVFLTAIGVIVSFASLTTLARTYPKTHLWKILPVGIVFAAGYHFRRAYGHELIDVTRIAGELMQDDPQHFRQMPNGPITFEQVEQRRLELHADPLGQSHHDSLL